MLERALTTRCCSEIISLLIKRRGWSISRIARVIRSSQDYVRRVQSQKQSFQMPEVVALAKACGQEPHRLIFDSIPQDSLTGDMRGLHELGLKEIQRHDEFRRALLRKPTTRKRRARTKAA